ncbi:unnamed protein product, partial [Closterium sp. NIES-53]
SKATKAPSNAHQQNHIFSLVSSPLPPPPASLSSASAPPSSSSSSSATSPSIAISSAATPLGRRPSPILWPGCEPYRDLAEITLSAGT